MAALFPGLLQLTHIYMAAHFPGLVQALQSKVEGLNHSLSWLGTGTSIKSGGVKLLTFLTWYRHFNKKWRG
jgi:hypothetical protein